MKTPRAVCPLRDEYMYVGQVISTSNIYEMTEAEFLKAVMEASYGSMNPSHVREVYRRLMEDAGLKLNSRTRNKDD